MNNLEKIKSMPVEQLAKFMVHLVTETEFTLVSSKFYSYWSFNDFNDHEVVQCRTEEQAIEACIEWLNTEQGEG